MLAFDLEKQIGRRGEIVGGNLIDGLVIKFLYRPLDIDFLVGAGTTTDGNGGGATGTPFDGVFWSAGLGFMYGGRPSETATPPSAPPSAAPTAPM